MFIDKQQEGNYTIALLIDSDNVSAKYLKVMAEELESLGHATIKRIYGDFTKPTAGQWKEVLLKHGIVPVQQFAYTTGKNATDGTMIIDAMDILYAKNVDAFCLATSDSDFTRLASRLKESGMFVIGAGEEKTPSCFVGTCDRFLMLDALYRADEDKNKSRADKKVEKRGKNEKGDEKFDEKAAQKAGEEIVDVPKEDMILNRMRQLVGEDWALFAVAMTNLYKTYPQFNFRYYGKDNLKKFFEEKFDFKRQESSTIDLIKWKGGK